MHPRAGHVHKANCRVSRYSESAINQQRKSYVRNDQKSTESFSGAVGSHRCRFGQKGALLPTLTLAVQ